MLNSTDFLTNEPACRSESRIDNLETVQLIRTVECNSVCTQLEITKISIYIFDIGISYALIFFIDSMHDYLTVNTSDRC